jgi:hypothetical protein
MTAQSVLALAHIKSISPLIKFSVNRGPLLNIIVLVLLNYNLLRFNNHDTCKHLKAYYL